MILRNLRRGLAIGLLAAGCSSDGGSDSTENPNPTPDGNNDTVCVGKCDSPVNSAQYTMDMDALNQIWSSGGDPVEKLADFYAVQIKLPNGVGLKAGTHLFGDELIPIPYHDDDGSHVKDASGQVVFQGDKEIAKFFRPGQIGYAIKHHRPEKRVLNFAQLAGAGADGLKEDMKLQDTHIELVVGVQRPLGGPGGEMVDGVITLNNPQGYQNGRFGGAVYSMIFVKPAMPDYAPADTHDAFNDNIRTMMLGFNAVSSFPGDYNGGDPLAASDPAKVRNHTAKMIVAIAGEGAERDEARSWFTKQENMIYCAELAHVATSAGLLVPLNKAGVVDAGLVDEATFERFARILNDHNNGLDTPFTEMNDNELASLVKGTMSPDSLKPLASYGSGEEEAKIAFRPQTMAEIVAGFLATHIPRNNPALGGEALAPVQAGVLKAMQPGLYEAMGMDDGLFESMISRAQDEIASLEEDIADPEISEERAAALSLQITDWNARLAEAQQHMREVQGKRMFVDGLFEQILQVVGTSWTDYAEFQEKLAPLMAQARQLTGPRDDSGTGYFVPPSALHLIALGCPGDTRCGGLIGLDYVGHGIHISGVTINQAPPAVAPRAVVKILDVMPRPDVDSDGDGEINARKDETVTLHNSGDKAADLSYWTLSDEVKVRFEFPEGTMLPPGQSVYLNVETGDSQAFFATLGLNDNGDTLTVKNGNGDVMDVISWGRVQPGEFVEHNEE